MNIFNHILNTWYGKLLISTIFAIFSPFKITLLVLLVLIIIDTITGSIYAISINKFSSAGLKRGLKKIFIYNICILVVRLAEIGIEPLFNTIFLTNSIIAYLVLIETLSILENLALMDVALPAKLKNFIIYQIKVPGFKNLLQDGNEKREFKQEVLEMIDYHFPAINDYQIIDLLDIKFNEWSQFIDIIDIQLSKNSSENPDILYYRISSLIKATNTRIEEKWDQYGISKECINSFNSWHQNRVNNWLLTIKDICYSNETLYKKKIAIFEKLILLLYQTLTDVQKQELCKTECKIKKQN